MDEPSVTMRIFAFMKKWTIELIFLCVAFAIAFISLFFFTADRPTSYANEPLLSTADKKESLPRIMVEISGAVEKPGVYEVSSGARLKDLFVLAGNISDDADTGFVSRNFNLARFVLDQEKIYIPYTWDITNGTIVENIKNLDYSAPQIVSQTNLSFSPIDESVHINTADIDEIDTLPGIGMTTAQHIIDNRPYSSINDLLNKKIVKSNVFETIKNKISL